MLSSIVDFFTSTKFPTLDPSFKVVPGLILAYGPTLTLFSILQDSRCEKDLIVTEDVKSQNHQDNITNGPSKLVKELSDDSDWEIFNFFNNGIFKTRPSSTGLTILQKCQK